MAIYKSSKEKLFNLQASHFEEMALTCFQFQAENNLIYQEYLRVLNIDPQGVDTIYQIPFLPISFFKEHRILSGKPTVEKVFESSGTTGQLRSKHYISDLRFYRKVCEKIFHRFYGPLSQYHLLALLPSYLERDNASLVYMVDHFIRQSQSPYSGFFLDDTEKLIKTLRHLRHHPQGRKIFLIGVSFALLALAESHPIDLQGAILMETGGMKGRRKEMIREELHKKLRAAFNVPQIHSEYGMTELLSQAYSRQEGIFDTPPWMKIILRDLTDPLALSPTLRTGAINIIDLANWDSCAFLATQDLGVYHGENQFKVLGRSDDSEARGCNLMLID